MSSQKLFSYGTLQYDTVQMSTFGRLLTGTHDAVLGYKLSTVEITDPQVIALSGESVHKILVHTGNTHDLVDGMVFDLTQKELEHADRYEVDSYKRVLAQLRSGHDAWIYVDAMEKIHD